MARFFFNIAGRRRLGEDRNGVELPSIDAARSYAAALAEQLKEVGLEAQVVVGDQDGAPLFGVSASGRRPAWHIEPKRCYGVARSP